MSTPKNLTKGVFEPYPLNMYGNPLDLYDMTVVGCQTVVGTHGLRDRTAAIDPVSAEMARANAEYWSERGVRTIWRNDFLKAKRLLLDHTVEHHPAFRRAASGDLLAMKPERQRAPAEVVDLSELRAAREAALAEQRKAAAEAERQRIAAATRVEASGQIAAAF